MTPELAEIRDFLAGHPPFDALPADVLTDLVGRLEVTYVRRGTVIRDVGEDNDELFVVRSGAVDVHDQTGSLTGRREVGESFGMSSLMLGGPLRHRFTAIEDSLLLVLPGAVFAELQSHPEFRMHYLEHEAARLHQAVATVHAGSHGGAVLRTRVGDIVGRAAVSIEPQASIRAAAERMREHGLSSILVMRAGELLGILTDRDLRNRVLAQGLDPDQPVTTVMTSDLFTVRADALAFTLMLEMVGRNIHHVPVTDARGAVLGVVTSTDLIRLERNNPVFVVGDVAKRTDLAGLVEASALVPRVVENLVAQDATADDIGRMVTAIGDAIERRLITLLELELGPAPVPYAWLALGSRAREEQGLASDQDNGLILAEAVTGAEAAWFETFATRIRDGLEACGYPRCTGDVMATNPRWRQPVQVWRAYFAEWLHEPVGEAILNSSIFFDLRCVAGDPRLATEVIDDVRERAPGATRFLAHMARLATSTPPPLGFFRGFVLQKEGEHRDTLDLKHGGVNAVVTTARLYALAGGLAEVNTQARLAAAVEGARMDAQLSADLRDAFEFISYVRIRHQGQQVRAGEQPDNFVSPDSLSGFERAHLRDAFAVVREAQRLIAHRYPTHAV